MGFLAKAEAEAEAIINFGLRPKTKAEAEGTKILFNMFVLTGTPLRSAAEIGHFSQSKN